MTKSPKTILFITTGLNLGGAEVMLYHFVARIDRSKFSPHIISLLGAGVVSQKIESLGIPVYHMDFRQNSSVFNKTIFFLRLVKKISPDIIQGWMYHGIFAAQIANMFSVKKTPIVWSIHSTFHDVVKASTSLMINILKILSYHPRSILYVSVKSYEQHTSVGYCNSHAQVIPNGFDTAFFKPSSLSRAELRQKLSLNEKVFLVGLVARFHPMKDHLTFLKAASLVLEMYPEVHFVLAGKNVTPDNTQLNKWLSDLEISSNVHLLGEQENSKDIIAALDILSTSSAYGESFPMVIGEAMACGVPCVVTDVGDSAKIVGSVGFVVPSQSPEELANKWIYLLRMDVEDKYQLGLKARQKIEDDFSLQSVVSKYEELYQGLIS
jgi:glycosyltransferase involved in cell wall biosynthesis